MVPARQLDAGEHPEDTQSHDDQVELQAESVGADGDEGETRDKGRVKYRPNNGDACSQQGKIEQTENHESDTCKRRYRGIGESEDEAVGRYYDCYESSEEKARTAGTEGFTVHGKLVSLEPVTHRVMAMHDEYA